MTDWNVYLSGEIHSDWRDQIAGGIERAGLPVRLTTPVTNHAESDDCGSDILGEESKAFWKDRKGAGINAIRSRTLIRKADLVVVRFGTKIPAVERGIRCRLCRRDRQTISDTAQCRIGPRAQRSGRSRMCHGTGTRSSGRNPKIRDQSSLNRAAGSTDFKLSRQNTGSIARDDRQVPPPAI